MEFFVEGQPPTVTGQMHRVTIRNGHPIFYDTPRIKEAREYFRYEMGQRVPLEPLEGPVSLVVEWHYDCGKSHKAGEWKITRPDTDNLMKLLKDSMTDTGFWKNDSQVCRETSLKFFSERPGIRIHVEKLTERGDKI